MNNRTVICLPGVKKVSLLRLLLTFTMVAFLFCLCCVLTAAAGFEGRCTCLRVQTGQGAKLVLRASYPQLFTIKIFRDVLLLFEIRAAMRTQQINALDSTEH